MSLATRRSAEFRGWPITSDAQRRLIDEIAELREQATTFAAPVPGDDIVRLPAVQAAHRLDTLTEVLENARVVDQPGAPAIGRRATVRDQQGRSTTYSIVVPGGGDPSLGWVSADSPLGTAILGARPGQTIEVQAPSGSWTATMVSVD